MSHPPAEQQRWERFAQTDAEFYIRTEERDYSRPEALEAFFRSGRADADRILRQAEPHLGTRREVALEIGCGVGRLTLPMSRGFTRVRAVDVSPTMLRKLEGYCRAAGVENVEPFTPEASWDEGPAVDLAYSRWVLQHVESIAVIEDYLRRIAGCLHPEGVAHLQFDTRPATLAYRVRNALPDLVLPRTWRRGVRRIRRSPALLRETMARHGLTVVREIAPGSEEHVFLLRRAG